MKQFITKLLKEGLEYWGATDADSDSYKVGIEEAVSPSEFRFNDGKFNKSGFNTLYHGETEIVDFIVKQVGLVEKYGKMYPNSIEILEYVSPNEGKGVGTLGLQIIFAKLPKIENIIIDCYETALGFWQKVGGVEIGKRTVGKGAVIHTLIINKNNLPI